MYNNEDISLYLKDVRKIEPITREEEVELAKRIKLGDSRAEEKLILANLRFVISTAKQYQNLGIPLPDLINEGNYGMIKAAKRYDETSGNKFISYAVWWIKQSILQCINDNSRMIRLPVNLSNELLKIERKLGTVDEVTHRIPHPKVIHYDGMLNEDENISYIETFSDDIRKQPDQLLIKQEMSLKKHLDSVMFSLDEREKYVICNYYLSEFEPKTLEELGSELGLTKERVRQIRDKSIRKLRNNSESLFTFFN